MSEAVRPHPGLYAYAAGDEVPGGPPGPPVAEAVAAAFTAAVQAGRLDLPLPGQGHTRDRWEALADLAGADLSVARLAEGHVDAVAILAELGADAPPAAGRWGVWAAQPPGSGLTARRDEDGWRLDGIKQYCSGARSCTDALVTATAPDGDRLFAVSTDNLWPLPGTWRATGMAGSDTLDVSFDGIAAGFRPRRGRGGRLLVRRRPGCRPDAGRRRRRT
jgi:alkylation response protein AidB-like acyl-CoA dehydrogenase